MATMNQLVYDVRERFNAYSDDSNLSDEHIAFLISNFRNTLLQQYMSNLRNQVPANARQVICMDLDVDKQCFDKFNVVKSKSKIPTTLSNTGRNDLFRVHSSGSRFIKNINSIDYSRLPFIHAAKFVGSQLYISVDQHDYLIAYNTLNKHLLLEKLEVEGVFEDPEKAYYMSCDRDPNLEFQDSQYPIPEEMLIPLVTEVTNMLMPKKQIPVDNINNAEDDVVQTRQK